MTRSSGKEIEYHGGRLSHVDALCRVSYNGKLYNGLNFKEVVTERGCSMLVVAPLRMTNGTDSPVNVIASGDRQAESDWLGAVLAKGATGLDQLLALDEIRGALLLGFLSRLIGSKGSVSTAGVDVLAIPVEDLRRGIDDEPRRVSRVVLATLVDGNVNLLTFANGLHDLVLRVLCGRRGRHRTASVRWRPRRRSLGRCRARQHRRQR
jgi:hypothetical protein